MQYVMTSHEHTSNGSGSSTCLWTHLKLGSQADRQQDWSRISRGEIVEEGVVDCSVTFLKFSLNWVFISASLLASVDKSPQYKAHCAFWAVAYEHLFIY